MRYFEVFGIKPKFIFEKEDLQTLEENFLTAQKESFAEVGVLDLQAKILNESYEILKNEEKRLEYLLRNFNIEIEKIQMSREVAEYIFEIREDITDSETETEVLAKVKDVEIELEEIKGILERQINEALNGKVNKEFLCELYSKFKSLKEILKVHKKHAI